VRDLLLIGAGGFARETAAAVRARNEVRPQWNLRGFLDDNRSLHGTVRSGLPILGPLDMVADEKSAAFVVCVGNPKNFSAREKVVRRLDLSSERYATVIHPAATVGYGSTVGAGSVLLANVVLTADADLGAHVDVMPHTVITHDDYVADFATLAAGVRLGGSVRIGRGAYLGSGAMLRESVSVGAGSMVGMGSVVLTDVPAGEVWVGNPARHLRNVTPTVDQPVNAGHA
jgi:sugar O-acyltransferase (sialic acid O-acetyltransferase NeuD family)